MGPGENIKINVRSIEDRNESFELKPSDNILKLRQLARERFQIATNSILLLFRGKALKDNQTISNCNITNGDTVLLVKREHVGRPPASSQHRTPAMHRPENQGMSSVQSSFRALEREYRRYQEELRDTILLLRTPNQAPLTQLPSSYSQQYRDIIPFISGSLESMSRLREILESRLSSSNEEDALSPAIVNQLSHFFSAHTLLAHRLLQFTRIFYLHLPTRTSLPFQEPSSQSSESLLPRESSANNGERSGGGREGGSQGGNHAESEGPQSSMEIAINISLPLYEQSNRSLSVLEEISPFLVSYVQQYISNAGNEQTSRNSHPAISNNNQSTENSNQSSSSNSNQLSSTTNSNQLSTTTNNNQSTNSSQPATTTTGTITSTTTTTSTPQPTSNTNNAQPASHPDTTEPTSNTSSPLPSQRSKPCGVKRSSSTDRTQSTDSKRPR